MFLSPWSHSFLDQHTEHKARPSHQYKETMIGRAIVLVFTSMAGLMTGASVVHTVMKPDLTLPKVD